jgi:PAS domain S-box-containing protein
MASNGEILFDRSFAADVLASIPDCVKVLSADATLLYINARGLELLGARSKEEVLGKNYAAWWPADRRADLLEAIRGAALGARTTMEGLCPDLRGTPKWWEIHFHPIDSNYRGGADVVAISRDISARRESELNLRSNEEHLALLLESTTEGVSGINAAGGCTFINAAGATLLGYSKEELIGASLHAMIHHHDMTGVALAEHESPIFKATLTGKTTRVHEGVFWHKDGHAIPVSYSVFPMMEEAGPTGAVLTFSDNTERRRVENDLRHLASELSEVDRRKTEFIATLAHELRNPLAPLRTGLNLIGLSGDDPRSVRKIRHMMERQLGQMVHLINELLDIARITSGKIDITKERIEIARVVAAAVETSTPTIKRHEHVLDIDLPTEPLLVEGDAARLVQVFTNLLNNAAQFTPPRGHIRLVAKRSKDYVSIAVTDTGVGIPSEALGSIFEMFARAGGSAKGLNGGLGIGLNLVKRLAELHGGTASASSEGTGHGSTFTVRLPLLSDDQGMAHPGRRRGLDSNDEEPRLKILVVDDNVDAADTFSLLLEFEQHTVRVVHSGVEALLAASEMNPEVIFLDIGMPGMNGYDVARALRKIPDLPRPYLVALTGWGGQEDLARSREAGFDEHLTKPAEISSIITVIEKSRRFKGLA